MLKLRAEDTLDYSAALKRAAASASAVKHVDVRIPQEHVLVGMSYSYSGEEETKMIELDAKSLRRFLKHQTGLQTFELCIDECCERFTDEATDGGKALAELGKRGELQALRLTHPIFKGVKGFSKVLNPNLRELNLQKLLIEGMSIHTPWSRQTRKALVKAIAPLRHLVTLRLADNYFQDDDLEEFLSDRANLRCLDLSGGFGHNRANNHLITDEGLRIIVRTCPNLQSLDLAYQKAPTMNGVECILNGCLHLRNLSVGISVDASLSRILPMAKNLLHFRLDTSPVPAIVEGAALATVGQVIISSSCFGIIDLNSGSPECRRRRQHSKSLLDDCYSKLEDPTVFNQWESLFEVDVSETSSSAPTVAEASSNTSLSCSWFGCPSKGDESTNLQTCSRCKKAWYCSRKCQKAHWEIHKYKCVAPTVPRHVVEEFTISSVQTAIDGAAPGDVVVLKEGTYESGDSRPALTIDKPLYLVGPLRGMDSVKLVCNLVIKASGSANDGKGVVNLADFEVSGTGNLMGNKYKAVNLYNVRISCPNEARDDAFSTGDLEGKCLLLDCEIHGGSDGVHIGDTGVHLKRTEIRFARNRGIFSRCPFVIEDSTIDSCGGYGIKGTAGWTDKGQNDIQPGPWSSFGAGGGGFGGGFGF